jgi:hypothetical protein
MLRTTVSFLVFPSLLQCVCKLPEHLLVIHNLQNIVYQLQGKCPKKMASTHTSPPAASSLLKVAQLLRSPAVIQASLVASACRWDNGCMTHLTFPVVENEVEQLLPGDWMFVNTYVVNIAVLLEGGDL